MESLGVLVSDPGVTWTKAEKAKVWAWLQDLETVRLSDISEVPVQHLSHLLRGLRLIEAGAARLQQPIAAP